MSDGSDFCTYCGIEMLWDSDLGEWVDIADGKPTECENSPDFMHMEVVQ